MSQTPGPLPQLLEESEHLPIPSDFDSWNLDKLRKPARTWVGADQAKLSKGPLVAALHKALNDGKAAKRVLETLSTAERQVVAVYRRYGGTVSGEVIRLELMARGLLEVVEQRVSEHY